MSKDKVLASSSGISVLTPGMSVNEMHSKLREWLPKELDVEKTEYRGGCVTVTGYTEFSDLRMTLYIGNNDGKSMVMFTRQGDGQLVLSVEGSYILVNVTISSMDPSRITFHMTSREENIGSAVFTYNYW